MKISSISTVHRRLVPGALVLTALATGAGCSMFPFLSSGAGASNKGNVASAEGSSEGASSPAGNAADSNGAGSVEDPAPESPSSSPDTEPKPRELEPATPFLDDSLTTINTDNDPSRGEKEVKYGFVIAGEVGGSKVTDKDFVRVDWKEGGKVLATKRCRLNDEGAFRCESEKKDLSALGAIEVALTHISDANDAETPLRTLKIHVEDKPEPWIQKKTRRQAVVDARGWMGMATVQMRYGTSLEINFFRSYDGNADSLLDRDFRCDAEGKRVPLEKLSGFASAGEGAEWSVSTPSGQTTRRLHRYKLKVPKVRRRMPKEKVLYNGEVLLTDYPGTWTCQLRSAGEVVREFIFKVDKDGNMVKHPEQLVASNPLLLRGGSVFVEQRFPNAAKFEVEFAPDAIRKDNGFGRIWSKDGTTAGWLKNLTTGSK